MTSKELLGIIKRNFFQPVVVAIYILAIILLLLGEWKDAYFVSFVITFNFLIGVVQEIRARLALHKLELMSAPRAHRVTEDNRTEDVLYTELRVDDVILLGNGDEVPADAELISSKGLEVDESILTGESAAVEKNAKDTVLASSTIVAGSARARVTATGDNTKAGQMTKKLKEYVPEVTPLQHKINFVIGTLTYGAIGLALLVAIVYGVMGRDLVQIFKTITSGAITIIPEGLLLGSTLLLAFGSLKLATEKVLPQKLTAIEAMALLNVLCTDKTGTLTEPEVTFDRFIAFNDRDDNKYYREFIGIAAQETSGGNATGEALMAAFQAPEEYDVQDIMAFSSERKMSGVRASYQNYKQALFMGAPEYVSKLAKLTKAEQAQVEQLTREGKRVLMVAASKNAKQPLKELVDKPGQMEAIGLIVLRNDLREGVKETIKFLQDRGVSIRVISGDNPDTVKYIAKKAGVLDPEKAITGAELAELDDKEWYKAVHQHTIFARVLPEQKERIITLFQKQQKFVGMVGDGINDALAIKKADLGVVMYSGAAATRRVADIVLLNNSFNALPIGMKLGNRIMQAIEIISTLFFHKVTYNIVLLLFTLLLGIVYPFAPRHNTFMNMFIVTLPTLMWTLFPPTPRYRINPRDYWRDTLFAVMPISIISGVTITFCYWYLHSMEPHNTQGVATMIVMAATFFGMYLVFLTTQFLRVEYNKTLLLGFILYACVSVIIMSVTANVDILVEFFEFKPPSLNNILPVILLIAGAAALQWMIAARNGRRIAKRELTSGTPHIHE